MIQFNLLPDVKIKYIKARRTQRLMTLVSVIVIATSLFVFLLMMTTVNVVQRKSLGDLNDDIKKYSTELKSTKDLDKILTVQNQLGTLTGLHEKKPVTSRIFSYLTQVTPAQASLDSLKLDFTENSFSITGRAPSFDIMNAYTDTLKVTTFTTDEDSSFKHAFSNVVLTAFSRDPKEATYTITAVFDPTIFSNASPVILKVPVGPRADAATLFTEGN